MKSLCYWHEDVITNELGTKDKYFIGVSSVVVNNGSSYPKKALQRLKRKVEVIFQSSLPVLPTITAFADKRM